MQAAHLSHVEHHAMNIANMNGFQVRSTPGVPITDREKWLRGGCARRRPKPARPLRRAGLRRKMTETERYRRRMPYADGKTPITGDHVRHVTTLKTGTVTHVDLNAGNTPGHDQVSVRWDDGSVGVGISLADEYRLMSRAS